MNRERALEERLDEIERLVRTLVVRVTELELHGPAPAEPPPGPRMPTVPPRTAPAPAPRPPEPVVGSGRRRTRPREVEPRPSPTSRRGRSKTCSVAGSWRGSAARDRRRSRLLPRHRRRPRLDRRRGESGARLRRLDGSSRGRPLPLRAARPDRAAVAAVASALAALYASLTYATAAQEVIAQEAGSSSPASWARPARRSRCAGDHSSSPRSPCWARLRHPSSSVAIRRGCPSLHGRRARGDGWSSPCGNAGAGSRSARSS